MAASFSPEKESDKHACKQQHGNKQYNQVIFFHYVLYYIILGSKNLKRSKGKENMI